ncbi:hypothetical protein BH10BAC5_BH10BAC5_15480 [soil metagenome]
MNSTKNFLLVSSDKEFCLFAKTTALTLTKLNVQATIDVTDNEKEALKISNSQNLNTIILDLSIETLNPLKFIKEVRSHSNSKMLKIISFSGKESFERKEIFEAGCDSIMTKKEIQTILPNIIQF